MKVVLVDDDFINRLVLTKFFEKIEGTSCISLENGEELIQYLQNTNESEIDYIFLDLRMPVLDGFEFLNWFSENQTNSTIKIIVLTSSIDFRDKQKVSTHNCVSHYFQKPMTPEKLNAILA